MFDPRAADGLRASYGSGEDRFRVVVDDARLEVVRGAADRPEAVGETNSATLAALVYEGRDLAEALHSGYVKIEGDESAVVSFLGLFSLPEATLE